MQQSEFVFYLISALIACAIYFFLASMLGKKLKGNANAQTITPELPVLPTVTELKRAKKFREGLVLGNQRQRRKKFRQSKFLYLKYGK